MRELHRASDLDLALVGLFLPGDHAEERRLARAVGADDADDRAGRHLERELVDEQALAVALRDLVELDDLVAEALGHRDEDLLRFVARLVLVLRKLLEARQARLGLRLPSFRVLAHPLELGLHRLDARRLLALLDLQALFLLVEPARVIAFPRNAVAAVELEDPARGIVQEVPVVRDRDHGAGKALQELLEPLHALGVEVVRRLIQQQEVRLRQ